MKQLFHQKAKTDRVILRQSEEKTGERVVILVDEYDKSLLETEGELNDRNRALFKGFFGNLKSMDGYLKFSFITGITKFARTNIFSGLNQLIDLSLSEKYAAICGITQEELEANFAPEIESFAGKNHLSREACLAKLKKMYDGYQFHQSGKQVYNPFSLLNAFFDGECKSYWFSTGTPTMLIRSLEKNHFDPKEFDGGELAVSARRISDYRADGSDPVPLFYQSGYLTIKGYDARREKYILGYPNDEVKYAFLESIVPLMTAGTCTGLPVDRSRLGEGGKLPVSASIREAQRETLFDLRVIVGSFPFRLVRRAVRPFDGHESGRNPGCVRRRAPGKSG